MKLAVLILSAFCPNNLKPLAEFFGQTATVICHLDAKQDLTSYLQAAFPSGLARNFRIHEERSEIFWAGWNAIEATISMLRWAHVNGFEHSILISDDSFPLQRRDYILDYISSNKDGMPGRIVDESEEITMLRFKRKYLLDYRPLNPRYSAPHIARWSVDEKLIELSSKIEFNLHLPEKYKFVKGKQWFFISRETTDKILRIIESNNIWTRFFRSTSHPDESFFQTLLYNELGYEFNPPFMFDYWADPKQKPLTFSDPLDSRITRAPGNLFCRKLSRELSTEQIEKYYETLRTA